MRRKPIVAGAAAAASVQVAMACAQPAASVFEPFIGEWDMELMAHSETFGDRGGPGDGIMVCKKGLLETWVDCELDSHYDGLGHYVLKIVLYRMQQEGVVGAFVTNSFGGGRLYEGKFEAADKLVFGDAWIDPKRKWEHQRVTYIFQDDNKIEFLIEVASDGLNYLPHSSGVYRRK